jgi:hypothetical protein
MGGWAVAQSPILNTTITVDRLLKRGYISMLDIYKRISPQLNEPSRPGRDGVRASPFQYLLAGRAIRLATGCVYIFF